MPTSPRPGCPTGGCPNILPPGKARCSDHEGFAPAPYERDRASSTARGYDETWKKFRLTILHRDPVCKKCERKASEEVDHIVPLAAGGARLDPRNAQGLCNPCHSTKTATEDGGFGRPPGRGGKS